VQGCEIFINPLFYCPKFREELEFKVCNGFPTWLSLLKNNNKCLWKKNKRKKSFERQEKGKKRSKENPPKKRRKRLALLGMQVICDFRLFLSSFGDLF